MKQFTKVGVGALLVVTLAGCAVPVTQEQSGMVVGGIVGGVVGSQFGRGDGRTVATILGTVIGASIGGNIGRAMDENDRIKTAHALETVRTSVPTRWVNPDSRHVYTVVPTRTYDGPSGPCREYTVDAVIGGRTEKVVGTACRQPDGSWRNIS
ncbi:MAG: glycine zipper 2TM domain-containing protein [Burkholderiaceae bacterium]|nr:glycine zipper 2TM domain-containing protein [Burkholderiaceae bacterium]